MKSANRVYTELLMYPKSPNRVQNLNLNLTSAHMTHTFYKNCSTLRRMRTAAHQSRAAQFRRAALHTFYKKCAGERGRRVVVGGSVYRGCDGEGLHTFYKKCAIVSCGMTHHHPSSFILHVSCFMNLMLHASSFILHSSSFIRFAPRAAVAWLDPLDASHHVYSASTPALELELALALAPNPYFTGLSLILHPLSPILHPPKISY